MKRTIFFFIMTWNLTSCSSSFLDIKPNSDIVIPTTLEDCRRLLDNDGRIIHGMNLWFPALGQLASDEYYYDEATWQSTSTAIERNSYVWAGDVYEGSQNNIDWNDAYYSIYICNVVLDVLGDIELNERNTAEYKDVKGMALFFRAMWYHALTEVFCMPYDGTTAPEALGLPLRTSPNIDELKERAPLSETFDRILTDLNEAVELLAKDTPVEYRNRPSKSAAYALLARVYLIMGDYERALVNSTKSFDLYHVLIDYNDLQLDGDAVFDSYNPEVLVMTQMKGYRAIGAGGVSPTSYVDSTLIRLYDVMDLRLQAFFTFDERGNANRKSLYTTTISTVNCFNGLATDEVILIRAECLARAGNLQEAGEMLDMLLQNRMANGMFESTVFENIPSAVETILNERRKELLFRGIRWSDVRRLNVIGADIEMQRTLGEDSFSLKPNSPRFAFPIPDSEILYSNITQNLR